METTKPILFCSVKCVKQFCEISVPFENYIIGSEANRTDKKCTFVHSYPYTDESNSMPIGTTLMVLSMSQDMLNNIHVWGRMKVESRMINQRILMNSGRHTRLNSMLFLMTLSRNNRSPCQIKQTQLWKLWKLMGVIQDTKCGSQIVKL